MRTIWTIANILHEAQMLKSVTLAMQSLSMAGGRLEIALEPSARVVRCPPLSGENA
jgi:hypothetical protein